MSQKRLFRSDTKDLLQILISLTIFAQWIVLCSFFETQIDFIHLFGFTIDK